MVSADDSAGAEDAVDAALSAAEGAADCYGEVWLPEPPQPLNKASSKVMELIMENNTLHFFIIWLPLLI